ncbi:MAG: 50S ribosomal protein L17 [Elusimicrobiota bacterium]
MSLTHSHSKALYTNIATSLIIHEKIITTLSRAKYLRPFIENLINTSKNNSITSHRHVAEKIKDERARKKLFAVLGPRYAERTGGYIQILKLAPRSGDSAPRALVRLIQ